MADPRPCRAGQYQWRSRTSFLWTVDKLLILSDTKTVCTVLGTHTINYFLNIFPTVIGCLTTEHLELNLTLFKLQSGEHYKQNKSLRGRARDCESNHKHHTKNEGSENKWLQGGDNCIDLEGPKRSMPGVQRSTEACWTCDELVDYTNCQIPQENSSSAWPIKASAMWSKRPVGYLGRAKF